MRKQSRRKFSPDFKTNVVLEALKVEKFKDFPIVRILSQNNASRYTFFVIISSLGLYCGFRIFEKSFEAISPWVYGLLSNFSIDHPWWVYLIIFFVLAFLILFYILPAFKTGEFFSFSIINLVCKISPSLAFSKIYLTILLFFNLINFNYHLWLKNAVSVWTDYIGITIFSLFHLFISVDIFSSIFLIDYKVSEKQ